MKRFNILILTLCQVIFFKITWAQKTFLQKGKASYYANQFHGKRTSSGEKFDMNSYSAAHRTLPFGTLVKVTNIKNKKAVIVKINDRGPHVKSRIIDLSKQAAKVIDLVRSGSGMVRVEKANQLLATVGPVVSSSMAGIEFINEALFIAGNTYTLWGTPKNLAGFSIQVNTFTDLVSAQELCRSLVEKGFDNVFIQVGLAGDTKIYRVLVNEHRSKEEAEKELSDLKSVGYNGFIKRYNS